MDTSYDVISKIVVMGADAATRALQGIDAASQKIDKGFKSVSKGIASMLGQIVHVTKELPGIGLVTQELHGAGEQLAAFMGQKLGIPTTWSELYEKAWNINEEYEKMEEHLRGIVLVTSDLSRVSGGVRASNLAGGPTKSNAEELQNRIAAQSPHLAGGPTLDAAGKQNILDSEAAMRRLADSELVSKALMKGLGDEAYRSAIPLTEMEGTFEQMRPLLAGQGKSMKDLVEFTGDVAAASKVLGVSTETASEAVKRYTKSGAIAKRSTDPFALQLQAELGAKKFKTVEERVEAVQKVLKKLGAPIKDVTQGTGAALQRWKQLSSDVLERTTEPIFKSIGRAVQVIDDYIQENEASIDAFTGGVTKSWDAVTNIASGLWDVGSAISDNIMLTALIEDAWEDVKTGVREAADIVEIISGSFDVIRESVNVLAGHGSMGKLDALLDRMYLRMLKLVQIFTDLGRKIYEIGSSVPWAHMEKLSEDNFANTMDKYIAGLEKADAANAKRFGLADENAPTMSKKKADDVLKAATAGGAKLQINMPINRLEIKQDFRDTDPDRVMLDMVTGFERIAEAAVHSSAGGHMTSFGPGASYGGG